MDSTEDELWQELTKTIVPIKKSPRETTKPAPKLKVTPKITANLVYGGNKLDNLEIGNSANIDANTAKRFKKGEFRIEAELDLHGCTEDRAYEKVTEFIKNSYLHGRRCVAIITGKGLHAEENCDFFNARGVLKDRVPQWLNLPEIRPLILAITHPEPKEGGSGVIKILLRRQRFY
uniref:Smr domain-containing protein n=1 Tax=uncultured Alphaproteobacteria bacterium TaxID=91750 RepID=A0A6M4NN35_9PROT|nr:hypothetical protein PlAlph_1730 [uncultured Alphaproteobacteria bacterium]